MAGGLGAKPDSDGLDTGGLLGIPVGRIPDVEMTEFMYPVLALWRREEVDSGGPGRRRGGVSASLGITPHGTSLPVGLVLASAGKAVSQNNGMSGGYPGNSGREVITRGADVRILFERGKLPASLGEVGGVEEVQPCYGQTHIAPGEVFAMLWQGGGGYGDPLLRDVELVAVDVRDGYVSSAAAHDIYGVVLDNDHQVDHAATAVRREAVRRDRRALSGVDGESARRRVPLDGAERLDDNLVRMSSDAGDVVACASCATVLGPADDTALDVLVSHGPTTLAGPRVVEDPATYVNDAIEFRQYFCPGCLTIFSSSVVPADHPHYTKEITWAG